MFPSLRKGARGVRQGLRSGHLDSDFMGGGYNLGYNLSDIDHDNQTNQLVTDY